NSTPLVGLTPVRGSSSGACLTVHWMVGTVSTQQGEDDHGQMDDRGYSLDERQGGDRDRRQQRLGTRDQYRARVGRGESGDGLSQRRKGTDRAAAGAQQGAAGQGRSDDARPFGSRFGALVRRHVQVGVSAARSSRQ